MFNIQTILNVELDTHHLINLKEKEHKDGKLEMRSYQCLPNQEDTIESNW